MVAPLFDLPAGGVQLLFQKPIPLFQSVTLGIFLSNFPFSLYNGCILKANTMQSGMTFVDPVTLVRKLEIAPGAVVVDFGCGAGYFTFEAAKAVGAEGKVYALDILPTALEAVVSRAKVLGLGNIEVKRANLEKIGGSGLQPESVDWVILKDMLFQNQNKEVILQEIARVLKKEGRLFLMEWVPEEVSMGPEEGMRISEEDTRVLLEAVGLHPENTLPAGDFHYALLARR